MNFYTFKEYIQKIDEGLIKTYELNFTLNTLIRKLNDEKIEYLLIPDHSNGTFKLKIGMNSIEKNISTIFQYAENVFGYFPSSVDIILTSNMKNSFIWTQKRYEFILHNQDKINEIVIVFERKIDDDVASVSRLYHLTTDDKLEKIIKYGLFPKEGRNKIAAHPNRIYLCKSIDEAKLLYPDFIFLDNFKDNKSSSRYCIIEIINAEAIKLKKDPNFKEGVYTTQNISPKNINPVPVWIE